MAWNKAPEQERRDQITDAALRVAVRDGLARLTVRAVAEDAQISHGLVLFHFATRAALLEALLDRLLEWFLTASTPPPGDSQSFLALIRSDLATAGTDRDKVAVLLDYWVVGMRTPALRKRLRDAITRYEVLLGAPAPGTVERPVATTPAAVSRQQLAALGTAVIFGTALRSLLEDDPHGDNPARNDPLVALENLLAPTWDPADRAE